MNLAGMIGLGKLAGFVDEAIFSPVKTGISNIISGGNWKQSGSAVAAQNFNANEAQKVRDWETQMSNTAYQRSTEDMKKAGLNPAMMYSNGANPASTPGGSTANSAAGGNNGGRYSNDMPQLINSAANLAKVFNYDKNPHNDVTTKQIFNSLGQLTKTIYSENVKY